MHRTIFFRQLSYWSFHCLLNALPSFCIAVIFLDVSKSSVAAMSAAIATFILLYAVITSLPGYLRDPNHLLSRALRVGTQVRGWISGVSLVLLPLDGLMVTPDFWCGYYSAIFFDKGARLLGGEGRLIDSAPTAGFGEVFAVTMLEGFMLSFLILLISFFAVIVLQARDRRKAFLSPGPCRPGGI